MRKKCGEKRKVWVYNIYMSPHHFSKQMNNPYFRTKHYIEESNEMRIQDKVEKIVMKILDPFGVLQKVKSAAAKRKTNNESKES